MSGRAVTSSVGLATQPHNRALGDRCHRVQQFRNHGLDVLKAIAPCRENHNRYAIVPALLGREVAIDGDQDIEPLAREPK